MRLVLLPGMDGTGALFEPFVRRLPEHVRVTIVSYPEHAHLDYEQLADRVREDMPTVGQYAIIAESYSGPLALVLAERPVGDLRAVVLVSSFISRPLGLFGVLAARLPLGLLLRIRPPDWVLRWLLLDDLAPPELMSAVRDAIQRVDPPVLAARIRDALGVDKTNDIGRCAVGLVCLIAAKDRLLRRSSINALRRAMPNRDVVSVSAPHLLLQCAPDAAVAALTDLGLLDDK